MWKREKVKCPYCSYSMPIFYDTKTECRGITIKCKGRNCGKEFEIKVEKGVQIK